MLTYENNSWKCWCVERCFVLKCLWERNYECSTYSKGSVYSFPPPLDNVILPLICKKPYHWMWRGRRGSSYSHRRQLVRRFRNFCKGLRSFYRRQHWRIIEGLWSLDLRVFAKDSLLSRDMTVLFSQHNQNGNTLEMYICKCVVFSYFVFVLGLLAFDY